MQGEYEPPCSLEALAEYTCENLARTPIAYSYHERTFISPAFARFQSRLPVPRGSLLGPTMSVP